MMQTVPRIDDGIALPDGRWLAYAEFGDPEGRPVLFFHATPGYRRNPWATDAELRSAGVRLIAPDRPGVGRSTPQPHRRLLDWPDDVRQLADALALQRFAVVGFSNGGPHAAACACKLGPRVSGTALVAPLPPLDAPGAVRQLGVPDWYYPLARRAPWALRAVYAGLVALARRDPRRAERLLVSGMSQADRRVFGTSLLDKATTSGNLQIGHLPPCLVGDATSMGNWRSSRLGQFAAARRGDRWIRGPARRDVTGAMRENDPGQGPSVPTSHRGCR